MPAVEEHLTDEQTREISMNLLNTIKIPRGNLRQLNSRLPKSNYEIESEFVNEEVSENEEESILLPPPKPITSKPEKKLTQVAQMKPAPPPVF
jgi:hypothetical protein